MARLLPGKTIHDARAQVGVIVSRLVAQYPGEHKGTRMLIVPESRARPDPAISEFLPVFAVIFAMVVASTLTGWVMSKVALRNFGCVNGDVMGATNELGKAAVLLTALAVLAWL
jgi:cobalamin synthase